MRDRGGRRGDEPLLAKDLFDTVRKADEQKIPEAIEQTEELADAGFAEEAAMRPAAPVRGSSNSPGRRARGQSVLGDETAALRLAQSEVEDLADQINREIAQATGEPPDGPGNPSNPPPKSASGA